MERPPGRADLVAGRDTPALRGRRRVLPDRRERQRPQPVDTGCVAPMPESDSAEPRSRATVRSIVFVRDSSMQTGCGPGSIATMDLASGRVTVLSSTADAAACARGGRPTGSRSSSGATGQGHWRPDRPGHGCRLRRRRGWPEPPPGHPQDARRQQRRWSPDGSRIVFMSRSSRTGTGTGDIYTIRPDGTDLRQLTDGRDLGLGELDAGRADPVRPGFERRRQCRSPGWWTMDADGTKAAMLVPRMLAGDELPPGRRAHRPGSRSGERPSYPRRGRPRRPPRSDRRRPRRPPRRSRTCRPASPGRARWPPPWMAHSARRRRCSPTGACSSPWAAAQQRSCTTRRPARSPRRVPWRRRAAARPRRCSLTAASCSPAATTAREAGRTGSGRRPSCTTRRRARSARPAR